MGVTEFRVLALLMADRVITEDNGKKGILGIFDQFSFAQFPAVPAPWYVFASIGGLALGKHEVAVNLVREEAAEVVMSIGGEVDVRAQGNVDLALQVANIRFSKPGDYTLSLHIGGETASSRTLKVRQRTSEEKPK